MTTSLKRLVKSSPLLATFAVPVFRAWSIALAHLPVRGPLPGFTGRARLDAATFGTFAEYEKWRADNSELLERAAREDAAAVVEGQFAFGTAGYCAICDAPTTFVTTMEYSVAGDDGFAQPNWREHLICRTCGLRNRMRAALHLAIQDLGLNPASDIYVTEQFGRAYRWLRGRFKSVVGSEYLSSRKPSGARVLGINHQDLQDLSFPAESFDFVLSFDVLEHVPDVTRAYRSIAKVLRPGGTLVLTIPFTQQKYATTVRAVQHSDGQIEHLLPIEVHGNPTDPINGALCFRHFGWDTLEQLQEAGFRNTRVHAYRNLDLGYLGGMQILVSAEKA